MVVIRPQADLAGVARVDLVSQVEGQRARRQPDIPAQAAAGEVLFTERVDVPWALGRQVVTVRLLAVEADGSERGLGEYTLAHTPWTG